MYLEKDEILHLVNNKIYKVINFDNYNSNYYYLLENVDNNKYIVVNVYLINSELYLKVVNDEELLKSLKF